jgi:hypothetical protein
MAKFDIRSGVAVYDLRRCRWLNDCFTHVFVW